MGLSAALEFAAAKDRVIAGVRSEDGLAHVRSAAAAAGVDVEPVLMDVCDDQSVTAAFDDIARRHGEIDGMVANAGVGAVRTLEELSMADLRAAMEINFYGVVRATKAVLPSMRRRGEGRLIAVSSVGGALGQPFTEAYCAAKFAVEGLYESLHPVAAQFGVKVSIVEPGPVATEFSGRSLGAGRERLWTSKATPMARFGTGIRRSWPPARRASKTSTRPPRSSSTSRAAPNRACATRPRGSPAG
jgi:NAD(P)-dependent dehydrogenase (short-subunit alcohol dehydrogenase family)